MDLLKRFMSADKNTRSLQLSGMVRFLFVFLQGVVLVKAGVPHEIIGLIEMLFFLSEFSRFFVLNGAKTASFAWSDDIDRSRKGRYRGIHLYSLLSVAIVFISYYFSVEGNIDFTRLSLLMAFTFFTILAEQYDWIFIEKEKSHWLIPYSAIVYGIQAIVVCLSIIYGSINLMLGLATVVLFLRWLHLQFLMRSDTYIKESMYSFFPVVTPLIAQAAVNGIMPYIDLWVVEYSFDESTFLYFRYGARQFPLFMIVLAGLRQGLLIDLKKKSAESRAESVRKEIQKHTHLIFIPAILLMIFSPFLYQIVYDSDFIASAFIFNTYLLIIILHLLIIQIFFFLERDEWMLFRFSVAEALFNLILSISLAQFYGIQGIIWATVFANILMKGMQLYWVRTRYKIKLQELIPLRFYFMYSVLLIAAYLVAWYIYF